MALLAVFEVSRRTQFRFESQTCKGWVQLWIRRAGSSFEVCWGKKGSQMGFLKEHSVLGNWVLFGGHVTKQICHAQMYCIRSHTARTDPLLFWILQAPMQACLHDLEGPNKQPVWVRVCSEIPACRTHANRSSIGTSMCTQACMHLYCFNLSLKWLDNWSAWHTRFHIISPAQSIENTECSSACSKRIAAFSQSRHLNQAPSGCCYLPSQLLLWPHTIEVSSLFLQYSRHKLCRWQVCCETGACKRPTLLGIRAAALLRPSCDPAAARL